jgi:hypothetical protein
VSQQFEVAVVGLGAMGSATLLDLARRGVRAVGFDRFHPPHTLGSTHGKSRIIRQAYFEDPVYVPLVRRAYERWDLLTSETGVPVFQRTGGLMLGPRDGLLVSGSRLSAMTHQVPFEELDAAAIVKRFPISGLTRTRRRFSSPMRECSIPRHRSRPCWRAGEPTRRRRSFQHGREWLERWKLECHLWKQQPVGSRPARSFWPRGRGWES